MYKHTPSLPGPLHATTRFKDINSVDFSSHERSSSHRKVKATTVLNAKEQRSEMGVLPCTAAMAGGSAATP